MFNPFKKRKPKEEPVEVIIPCPVEGKSIQDLIDDTYYLTSLVGFRENGYDYSRNNKQYLIPAIGSNIRETVRELTLYVESEILIAVDTLPMMYYTGDKYVINPNEYTPLLARTVRKVYYKYTGGSNGPLPENIRTCDNLIKSLINLYEVEEIDNEEFDR